MKFWIWDGHSKNPAVMHTLGDVCFVQPVIEVVASSAFIQHRVIPIITQHRLEKRLKPANISIDEVFNENILVSRFFGWN